METLPWQKISVLIALLTLFFCEVNSRNSPNARSQLPGGVGKSRRKSEIGGRVGRDTVAHGKQLPGADFFKKMREMRDREEKKGIAPPAPPKRPLKVRVSWSAAPESVYGADFKYVVQQKDPESGEYKDVAEEPKGTHETVLAIPNVRPSEHRYRVLVEGSDGNRHQHGGTNELQLHEDGTQTLLKNVDGGGKGQKIPSIKKSNMRNPIEMETRPGENDESDGVTYVGQVETDNGKWQDVKQIDPPSPNIIFDSPYTCGEYNFRVVHRKEGAQDKVVDGPEFRAMEPIECPEYTPLIKTRFTPTAEQVTIGLGGPASDNKLNEGETMKLYKVNPDGSEELIKECSELPCVLDGLTPGKEITVRAAKTMPDGTEKPVGPIWFPPKAEVEEPITDIVSTQEKIKDPEGIVRLCRRMRGIDRNECQKMQAKDLPKQWQRRPIEDASYEYLPEDPRDSDTDLRPDMITTTVTPRDETPVTVDLPQTQKDADSKGNGQGGGPDKKSKSYIIRDLSTPDSEPIICDNLPCEIPLEPGVPHELLIEAQPKSKEPLGPVILPENDHLEPVKDRVYWDPDTVGDGSVEVCMHNLDTDKEECERRDAADGVFEKERNGNEPVEYKTENNGKSWLDLLGPAGFEHSVAKRMGVSPCEVNEGDLNYEFLGAEHEMHVPISPTEYSLAPDSTKPVKVVNLQFTFPTLSYDGVDMSWMSYRGMGLRGETGGQFKELVYTPMNDLKPKANKSSLDGVYFTGKVSWKDSLDPSYPIRMKDPLITGEVVQEFVRPRKMIPVPLYSFEKSETPGYMDVSFERQQLDETILIYFVRTKTATAETWETEHPVPDDVHETRFTVTVAVTDDSDPSALIVEAAAVVFVTPKPNIKLDEPQEILMEQGVEMSSSGISWASYADVNEQTHVLMGYRLRDSNGELLESLIPPPSEDKYNKNINRLDSPESTKVYAVLQARPKLDPEIFGTVQTKPVEDFKQEYEVHKGQDAWVMDTSKLKKFVNNYLWAQPEIEETVLYYILKKHINEQLTPVAILPTNQFRYMMPITKDEKKEEYYLDYAYAPSENGHTVPNGCELHFGDDEQTEETVNVAQNLQAGI